MMSFEAIVAYIVVGLLLFIMFVGICMSAIYWYTEWMDHKHTWKGEEA
jgi:ABC-type multidrug transport system permease subunit